MTVENFADRVEGLHGSALKQAIFEATNNYLDAVTYCGRSMDVVSDQLFDCFRSHLKLVRERHGDERADQIASLIHRAIFDVINPPTAKLEAA
jgi:hypothetical protein